MIELNRIVENQANLSSYKATKDEARAQQLELLIELTKPENKHINWHPLISTPFRYPPPHPIGRFRPRFGKNVFYGACLEETALYEYSYHLMKQRSHLNVEPETGLRTIFVVDANNAESVDIRNDPSCFSIMNKNNYDPSHEFILQNPGNTFIIYPSCRDPKHRDCVAVMDIKFLERSIKWESTIKYFYNYNSQTISWIDYSLNIQLAELF